MYPVTVSCIYLLSYILFPLASILYLVLWILYPASFILYLASCVIYTVCILYPASCILCVSCNCILYPAYSILHPVPCALYPFMQFLMSCILYPFPCSLYPVSCILTPVASIMFCPLLRLFPMATSRKFLSNAEPVVNTMTSLLSSVYAKLYSFPLEHCFSFHGRMYLSNTFASNPKSMTAKSFSSPLKITGHARCHSAYLYTINSYTLTHIPFVHRFRFRFYNSIVALLCPHRFPFWVSLYIVVSIPMSLHLKLIFSWLERPINENKCNPSLKQCNLLLQ